MAGFGDGRNGHKGAPQNRRDHQHGPQDKLTKRGYGLAWHFGNGPPVFWPLFQTKPEVESFQTFSLAIPEERTIKTLLLDRFLACMKPASTT